MGKNEMNLQDIYDVQNDVVENGSMFQNQRNHLHHFHAGGGGGANEKKRKSKKKKALVEHEEVHFTEGNLGILGWIFWGRKEENVKSNIFYLQNSASRQPIMRSPKF